MENKKKRVWMSVLGVIGCGISVGFFKRAVFGVDPFQSFMSGLDALVPIGFGLLYVIVNAALLLFSVAFDRRKIGLATLINLFFLGYIVEYSEKFLWTVFPNLGLAGRAGMFVVGIVAICFSSSFYFTADLGVSTYDAVSLILSERITKVKFRVWRIISDLVCILIGVGLFLLSGQELSKIGGMIGIGTIITAFFMGPLLQFFNTHVAEPYLKC